MQNDCRLGKRVRLHSTMTKDNLSLALIIDNL